MASVVKSFGLEGITPFAVNIECSITQGSVAFDIIGLPDAAVKESKERVRSALKTMGISLPYKRIVINLAPANVRKSGSIYDVPILIAIL